VDRNNAWFEQLRQAAYDDMRAGQREGSVDERATSSPFEARPHQLDTALNRCVEAGKGMQARRGLQEDGSELAPDKKLCNFVERSVCSRQNNFVARTGKVCYFAHLSYEAMYTALTSSLAVDATIARIMNHTSKSYSQEKAAMCAGYDPNRLCVQGGGVEEL
jgi:hypothetical protein